VSLPAMSPIERSFARFAYGAAILAAMLGFIGISGWIIGMPSPEAFSYGPATMKVNTGVALMLAGVALALTTGRSSDRTRLRVARGCALLVTLIGTATLAEYATGLNFGIDMLLMRVPATPDGTPPGRMAPNTALCFALIGGAQLIFDSGRHAARMVAQIATLLALFIGMLAMSGYFLSVYALYGVAGYTSMALPTAAAITLLAAGLLASRPDRGIAATLAQTNSAGATIRRVLPLIVIVPLLFAWLHQMGLQAALYGSDFGSAVTATLGAVVLSALALRIARVQGALESERTRSDEHVRLAMEATPNGMVIVDSGGTIVLVNAEIERLFGFPRAELIGSPVEKLVPPAARHGHEQLRSAYQPRAVARSMAPTTRELHGCHKDGGIVPVEVGLNPLRMPHGDFVLASVFDMRQREQRERAAERERFFQLSNDALCIANASGYFVQVNPAFERILGYTREEMLAVPYTNFVHPDDLPATAREAQKSRAGECVQDFRNRYRAKDGAYRWLQWRSMPDQSGLFYATARDITLELEATSALQAGLRERTVLLQEVHHRVKNNLQIIASMINMQVRTLPPGNARAALEECGSRVQAIGLIHATLYQTRDFARIPFRDYVTSLVDNIFHASAANPANVARRLDIVPVFLSVDKAIPCGLIINELVTNALKHAFPDGRRGTVQVTLRDQGAGQLQLSVVDDGIGLGTDFDAENSVSMGLTLITTLVEQLKGRLTIMRSPGATFGITFPLETPP
jgi:PAS domain S-box-containing protein